MNSEETEKELKTIETLWINRLMSGYPQGLNWIEIDPNTRHQYYNTET